MRKTILFLSLGFLGYTLYNKYGKGNPKVTDFVDNASRKLKETLNNLSSTINAASPSNTGVNLDPRIEAQIQRKEGLTDEAKVGIND